MLPKTEKETVSYQFFEKDCQYGYMTIIFLFYPGMMSFTLNLMNMMKTRKLRFKIILIHFCLVPFFPVLMILQRIISLIVVPDQEWKKLNNVISNLEADFESHPQLALDMFAIFNHPNRNPSKIQV